MLVSQFVAKNFLNNYKKLMTYLNNGEEPADLEEYMRLRELLLDRLKKEEKNLVKLAGNNFYEALTLARYGRFVYLKKYQKGYVFWDIDDGRFYQVLALTTPLETLLDEYSVCETTLVPYKDCLICDGLLKRLGVSVGKNMAKDLRNEYWAAKRSGSLLTNPEELKQSGEKSGLD